MKTKEEVVDIQALKRQGLSQRAIGRKLGIDPRIVKKYLHQPETAFRERISLNRSSKLDPF